MHEVQIQAQGNRRPAADVLATSEGTTSYCRRPPGPGYSGWGDPASRQLRRQQRISAFERTTGIPIGGSMVAIVAHFRPFGISRSSSQHGLDARRVLLPASAWSADMESLALPPEIISLYLEFVDAALPRRR